jgi:adiponectin receptor
MEDPTKAVYEVSRVPLFLHILGAVVCMGCSAIFHLFKDHSPGASQYLSRIDYAGISVMITGSSISPVYYSYYCQENHTYRNIYITCMSVASTAVFVVSLWPKFDKP